MTRIFTPPDFEFNGNRPRILIRNCPWTSEELQLFADQLSDAEYDIYVYHDSMQDYQWLEGVRTRSVRTFNYNDYKTLDFIEWLRTIDNVIR